MKKDPFCITEPVFRSAVSIYANCSWEDVVKNVKKHRPSADINIRDGDEAKGRHNILNGDFGTIRLLWLETFSYDNVEALGILVHEVDHLVWHIMKDMGIGFCDSTREVHAYLSEFYFTAIAASLKKRSSRNLRKQ